MKIPKPTHLYHGSPEDIDRIEPRPARGVGPEKDRLNAVYATHIRNLAIVFSLPFTPNEDGNLSFRVSLQADKPEIHLEAGSLATQGRMARRWVNHLRQPTGVHGGDLPDSFDAEPSAHDEHVRPQAGITRSYVPR